MKTLVVDIFPFGESLDTLKIRSASQFIIISHLTRPLVSLDSEAQIEGNLAESWTCSLDFKEHKFKLKKNQKFLNGEIISPWHVVETILRQIRNNVATHYDFSRIKTIEAKEDVIIFTLKEPDVNFFMNTYNPEFGVLHDSDFIGGFSNVTFKISSGPYKLINKEENSIVVEKNNFYDFNTTNNSPDRVKFISSTNSEKINKFKRKELNFAILNDSFSFEKIEDIVLNNSVTLTIPRIGFSYWISIDPRKKIFKKQNSRNEIQMIISNSNIDYDQY